MGRSNRRTNLKAALTPSNGNLNDYNVRMETRLLDLLVCPLCKGRLYANVTRTELICKGDRLAFPVRDGVPVMLEDQARSLGTDDAPASSTQSELGADLPPSGTTSA